MTAAGWVELLVRAGIVLLFLPFSALDKILGFGNAVDHRDAVLLMDGFVASNYNDSNINRTALSPAADEDTQVKVGGVDAASPMGYGLVLIAVG